MEAGCGSLEKEESEFARVIFRVRAPAVHPERNDVVFVTGSLPILGNWSEKAMPLWTSRQYHPVWWSKPVPLPAAFCQFEYKYFHQKWVDAEGDDVGLGEAVWEFICPRTLRGGDVGSVILIDDAFGASLKGKVLEATEAQIEIANQLEEARMNSEVFQAQTGPLPAWHRASTGQIPDHLLEKRPNLFYRMSSAAISFISRAVNFAEEEREDGQEPLYDLVEEAMDSDSLVTPTQRRIRSCPSGFLFQPQLAADSVAEAHGQLLQKSLSLPGNEIVSGGIDARTNSAAVDDSHQTGLSGRTASQEQLLERAVRGALFC